MVEPSRLRDDDDRLVDLSTPDEPYTPTSRTTDEQASKEDNSLPGVV
jgi:hypothetical protein